MHPQPSLLFVISAPRSGSTMLERMLESHSTILGGPEPHLITPLAHLGVWAKVDKAPYDHILAAEAQKLFVERLPGRENDYYAACRAYGDRLYGAALEGSGKSIYLDKTPAYALVLPFLANVYPDAKYVVLTRHPLATFSSYANSFFDGDYAAAQAYNPLLERYIPALAAFLRRDEPVHCHVRYEDLVADPESVMHRVYDYIGAPYEADTIDYGERGNEPRAGLGDPIGVDKHTRPTTASVAKWVDELAHDGAKRRMMEDMIGRLDPADLAACGYPLEGLWAPLTGAGNIKPPRRPPWTRYRIQRAAIVRLRAFAKRNATFRKVLNTLRLGADVLLRE